MRIPRFTRLARPTSGRWPGRARRVALVLAAAGVLQFSGCVSQPVDSSYESTWEGYSPKSVPAAVSDKK